MPANLTPDYISAETRYKAAKTVEDKIACLEEMLATVPKHKGTEKIQADIKGKLAKMRRAPRKKGAARRADPAHVPKEGAAQVVVLGAANAGKSQLVAALTKAEPKVAEYPFTTLVPLPAMMAYEDILLQLVDLPALGADSPVTWVPQAVRNADAALIVIDVGAPDPAVQLREIFEALEERKIELVQGRIERDAQIAPDRRRLASLMVANRMDLPDSSEMLELVREEMGISHDIIEISALTGEGLPLIAPALYSLLGLVRVYSKLRGKKPENNPFVLRQGQTVLDFAQQIHKDLVSEFSFAKVWGKSGYDGQRISRDYEVQEGDIIEIHT
jgi:hypothetical protein